MTAQPQQPPNAPDEEEAVLGALIFDARCIDAVAALIDGEDFYSKRNRVLYQAMVDMTAAGTPIDFVTLSRWLSDNGLLALAGGEQAVTTLVTGAYTAANAEAYARIVRDRAIRRRTIAIARETAERARDLSLDASEAVDTGVAALMKLHRLEVKCEWTMRQGVRMAIDQISEASLNGGALVGVPTGIIDLDELLGGLHRSDLVIVAARPAMGKTALMLSFAEAAARAQKIAGIISAEQPVQQLAMRMLSKGSKVEASRLRSARIDEGEWPSITESASDLQGLPIWIYDRSAPSMAELARIARKWKQEHGLDVLYVDYLQRIQADIERENKAERVGDVARGLKNLARDLDIAVVALAQVKREVELRANKRPGMADVSDSGEIEKEADQVLTLYRDEVYDANTKYAGVAEIGVCKNRHGAVHVVYSSFQKQTMTFGNLAGSDEYLQGYEP